MASQPEPGDRVTMDDDQSELWRRRLTDQVREAVEKDLRRRYTWLGFIALLVTSGTITLIVNALLAGSQIKLETASALQDLTTARITKAVEQSETLVKRTQAIHDKFREAAQEAQTRFEDLRSRGSILAQELWQTSERSLRAIEELRNDLDRLTLVVEHVAKQNESIHEPKITGDFMTIRESLKTTKEIIETATSTSSHFLDKYRSVMLGAWKIERWEQGFGEANSGTLLVYERIENNIFKGTMHIVTASDKREIQQDVQLTVKGTNVVMKGKGVTGEEWLDIEFTFELHGNALIGQSSDLKGNAMEVVLRRVQ